MDLCGLFLTAKLKQYVKDNLAAQTSAITLAYIAALEKKLTKHFHIKDFFSLEQGTFLEFLVKHIQVQLQLPVCVLRQNYHLKLLGKQWWAPLAES